MSLKSLIKLGKVRPPFRPQKRLLSVRPWKSRLMQLDSAITPRWESRKLAIMSLSLQSMRIKRREHFLFKLRPTKLKISDQFKRPTRNLWDSMSSLKKVLGFWFSVVREGAFCLLEVSCGWFLFFLLAGMQSMQRRLQVDSARCRIDLGDAW